jgi:4-alpha-glucanotransferase
LVVASLSDRASGILLHPTSLPGPHGNGDLGAEAKRFADFLVAAGQSFWQMLPVGPLGYGDSPYSAQSAFAGNPLLIALPPLVRAGYLSEAELESAPAFPDERVDYAAALRFRTHCLRLAFESAKHQPDFLRYRQAHAAWLEDYALFRALKTAHAEVEWTRWAPELRDREPNALAGMRETLSDEIAYRAFEQWLFDQQWRELHAYCAERGLSLIGDIPIFLAHDSADVWQHRELFLLDEAGDTTFVSGVPPDYFSVTGQRWGNPLYHWRRLHETGYAWWIDRMRMMLDRFDVVRLDHFIGFVRSWQIPAHEPTAVNGVWVDGPGDAIFQAFERALGKLPLIVEDLGEVTARVKALRDRFELPGTKILQFAFGTDPSASDFLPYNYPRRSVVYTGTHDNDTTWGWFHEAGAEEGSTRSSEQTAVERGAALAYLGVADGREIHWDMIRACLASVARTAIFPLQDVLGLGSEARMNRPGSATGNWEWRFAAAAVSGELVSRLRLLTRLYGRQPSAARNAIELGARIDVIDVIDVIDSATKGRKI